MLRENGSKHTDGLVSETGLCWRVGGGRKAEGGAREAESVWVTEAHDLAEHRSLQGLGTSKGISVRD